MNLQPWREVQDLLPPLSGSEYEQLKASIARDGIKTDLLVLPDGRIIDGHHRWFASNELEIEPPYTIEDCDEQTALRLAIILNIARRQLSFDQLRPIHEYLRQHREERKQMAMDLRAQGKTQEEVAEIVGVDQSTVSAWEEGNTTNMENHNGCIPDARVKIGASEHQAIYDRWQAGETQASIAANYKVTQQTIGKICAKVQRRIDREANPPPPPPTGTYSVIYADPPWSYNNSGFDQSAAAIYPTMSTEAICALPIANLAADECVLFLWATSPLLPEALQVMAAWGFEYKASRVWIKDRAPGMGWFVKTRHELLLIGVRGRGHPSERLDSVIEAPVTRHSAKPDQVYTDIERCYAGPKIELFARQGRDGWKAWGNEV